jgi:hypothetical protein
LLADAVLASEPDPPWLAIGLAGLAAFIVLGARTSYPLFFWDPPLPPSSAPDKLEVGVMLGWPPSTDEVTPGTLSIRPGEPVVLQVPREPAQQLRLHSAHSSADVGELRGLGESVPALVVRPATGELTFSFASASDRDAAYAALLADLQSSIPANVRIE